MRSEGSGATGASISNDPYRKYAPKWLREQPTLSRDEQRSVRPAPAVHSSTEEWRTTSKFTLWSGTNSEPSPAPPQQSERGTLTLMGGIVWVVSFAALGAILVLFAAPLWDGASGLLNADSKIWQILKP